MSRKIVEADRLLFHVFTFCHFITPILNLTHLSCTIQILY